MADYHVFIALKTAESHNLCNYYHSGKRITVKNSTSSASFNLCKDFQKKKKRLHEDSSAVISSQRDAL